MKIIYTLPLLLLIFCAAFTSNKNVSANNYVADTMAPKMKQYWLVFLLKGNNRGQDSVTAEQIQAGHMANIQRLGKEGVLVMAGPMGYDKELRGIFIMDAKDSATAAGYIKTDPAVIAGRLKFELHPWWTQTGTYIFK